MLQGDIAFRVHEVQGHVIVQPYAEKRPERLGRGTSEDLAEEVGGDLLVVRKDDGVVELDGHAAISGKDMCKERRASRPGTASRPSRRSWRAPRLQRSQRGQ
ncbi:hypothetical protein D3C80_1823360 [compost metagenome]